MGEARRKAEAAKKASWCRKHWRTGLAMLGPVVIIFVFLIAVTVNKTEPQSHTGQPSQEPVPEAAPAKTASAQEPVVINTPEGFAALARQCEASSDPFDWQQAITYWKAVISQERDSREAWRGYARNSIRLLLNKNSMQPSQPLPHQWLVDASLAASGYLQLARRDPLAHELAAYAAAFRGDQQTAIMHAGNAQAYAIQQGQADRGSGDLMAKVIMIASQRRNHNLLTPGQMPNRPTTPGVPPFPR